MHCDQCQMLAINGIACHETGCPSAWKEEERECAECGTAFCPEHSRDAYCSPCCYAAHNGLDCGCYNCWEAREMNETDAHA